MKAPTFSLYDQYGNLHTLQDYSGKWLIVYFYPKDDTPSCTTEACNFRDGREILHAMGAEVIGISKDTSKSHAKFAEKHKLDFTLLADPEHKVIEAFGSWKMKKFMGKEFIGITRDTYLINPDSEIVKKYENVDPKTHVGDIISDLENLKKRT